VPSVVGLSQADASDTLIHQGFNVAVLYAPGATVPPGIEIREMVGAQSVAAGTAVPLGTVIAITVGPQVVNASP
jgi:beta-lactam-binding protein with PASTA domain